MVEPVGLGDVYQASATLFQLTLAWIILRTDEVRSIRAGFALVIGISGIETLAFLLRNLGLVADQPLGQGIQNVLDTPLLWTLVFLLTQLPQPIGGQRGQRIAKRAWVASLVVLPVLGLTLTALRGEISQTAYSQLVDLIHDSAFLVAIAVLALWSVPRWLELQEGPLRGQVWLAIAGAGVSAFFQLGHRVSAVVAEMGFDPLLTCGGGVLFCNRTIYPAMAWFSLVALGRMAWSYRSRPRLDIVLLVTALMTAAGLGAWVRVSGSPTGTELATQVLRPMLIAGAMLRYESVNTPARVRRTLVPVCIVFFSLLVFLLTAAAVSEEGFQAQAVGPVASSVSLFVALGSIAALRRPLFEVARREPAASRLQRLERYRLALEKHHRQGPSRGSAGRLAELREALGISPEEHRVLALILSRHLLVPTRAVTGARSGSVVAGRYRVEEVLGRGGFGRALLALDEASGEEVVLKEVVRPWDEDAEARRESLHHEARLAGSVESDHVAQVQEVVEEGMAAYLVRDHVPGRTLGAHVATHGPLPADEAVGILRDVTTGLADLHDAGVVHLDLKPENVIVTPAGRAVIIDIGAGLWMEGETDVQATATLSQPGSRAGTLAWMAPEQLLGEPVDERTDLFALGALLHHMLTGKPPVATRNRSAYEVEDEIVRGAPPQLPEHRGTVLQELLDTLLARDPRERPPAAQAVLDVLERAA